MAKQLSLSDMLEIAKNIDADKALAAETAIMGAVSNLADIISAHFGINHDEPDATDGEVLCGFSPAEEGQPCPPPIDEADEGGDWD